MNANDALNVGISQNSVRRNITRGTALLLLIPLFCSIINFIHWYQPQKFSKSEIKSPLAFEQYLVDLHEIDASRRHVFARYGFVNQSDKKLTIQKIKPSCGCLQVRLAEKEFAPGQSGEFFLQIDSTNEEPGPKEFTAVVTYECGSSREAIVTCRAIMPMHKITVQPKALIFYQLGNEPITKPVKIIDYRRQGFKITNIKTQHNFVRPVPATAKKDLRGVAEQEIYVTITEEVPLGKHQSIITVQTDDPEYPEIKIPLLIQRLPPNALSSNANNKAKSQANNVSVVSKVDVDTSDEK